MRADGGRKMPSRKLRRMQRLQEFGLLENALPPRQSFDKNVQQCGRLTKARSAAPIPLRSLVVHGSVQHITVNLSLTAAVLLPGRSCEPVCRVYPLFSKTALSMITTPPGVQVSFCSGLQRCAKDRLRVCWSSPFILPDCGEEGNSRSCLEFCRAAVGLLETDTTKCALMLTYPDELKPGGPVTEDTPHGEQPPRDVHSPSIWTGICERQLD